MKFIRLLTVALLAIVFYLPANPVMAEDLPVSRAIPALVFVPADGSWTGTTNLGKSISFSVQSSGAQWNTFKLTTSYTNGGCSVTLTMNAPGGSIVNGQFNWAGSYFAFTGEFTSELTATGTYMFTNQPTGCGTFSQSGTWTASVPPPVPAAFEKSTPINGASSQPRSLNLNWGSSTWATAYEYCYDTTNDSTCDGSWTSNGANTSIGLSGLTANTTYFWQVRATNASGTTYADANTWWSFTTGNMLMIYLPLVIR